MPSMSASKSPPPPPANKATSTPTPLNGSPLSSHSGLATEASGATGKAEGRPSHGWGARCEKCGGGGGSSSGGDDDDEDDDDDA